MKRLVLSVCLLSLLFFSVPVQAINSSDYDKQWVSSEFSWKSITFIVSGIGIIVCVGATATYCALGCCFKNKKIQLSSMK
jgi:NhaP-type Na+/H+ or K+/H+ antiporter